ncbi:sugar ABC transporter permease [Mycoplasma iguanae]|uniref:Sugar ABC transporter permease n=1 Tax=Mycoplasma iguanae TaxID=292461 RepID=A0ABY5RA01_9MOLU|nr:sugar ABC transporter permease [Mycoplasma iguanae]UVD81815.1 sugar ABC transporter permease [Mycoplasma iguanae]
MNKFNWKNLKASTFLIPLLVITVIFILYPLINTFIDSFKSYHRYSKVNFDWSFKNFESILNDSQFQAAFGNTTIVLLVATPLGIILAFLFALLVNSLTSKLSKNVLITMLYSQFFISIFAIGTSFIFLFGNHYNAFNQAFNSNYKFTNNQPLFLYVLFHIWRIFPFNSVLFIFAITKAIEKNYKKMRIDNLSLKDKIFHIYSYELKKSLVLMLYINFMTVMTLFPEAILGQNFPWELNHAHTLTSYIFEYINPKFGIEINDAKAAASGILVFLYILFLIILFFTFKISFRFFNKKNMLHKQKALEDI